MLGQTHASIAPPPPPPLPLPVDGLLAEGVGVDVRRVCDGAGGPTSKVMLWDGAVIAMALLVTETSGEPGDRGLSRRELICQACAMPPAVKFARLTVTGVLPCCLLITITVSAPSEERTAAKRRKVVLIRHRDGNAGVAERGFIAVVVPVDLAGEIRHVIGEGHGVGIFGDGESRRKVDTLPSVDAEHIGLGRGAVEICLIAPVVLGDADWQTRDNIDSPWISAWESSSESVR